MADKFVTRSGVVVSTNTTAGLSVGFKPVADKKPKSKSAAEKSQKKE